MCAALRQVRVFKQDLQDFTVAYVPEADAVYLVDRAHSSRIPDSVRLDEGDVRWVERQPFSEKTPTDLDLLLTTACNLACKYCYSDAGEAAHTMSDGVACRAIEYVADNAKRLGQTGFSVLFHGEGEPTANWPTLTAGVKHAREYAARLGLTVHFSLATNGVFSDEKRNYLGRNLQNVTVSLDGPRWITDGQRRRRNGRSSFAAAFETARYFWERRRRINFGIRATLLPAHVRSLPQIVRFFGLHFPGSQLSVEPVEFVGRFADTPREPFEGLAFAYRRARCEATRYDLDFWYSAVRGPRATDYFCGVAGRSMVVGPTGLVSGCSRVSQWKHAGAGDFIYGAFKSSQSAPEIDHSAKRRVETYAARNMPDCANCIAYAWCRGDCRHIRYIGNGDVLSGVSSRCREIRTIVLGELLDTLKCQVTDQQLAEFYAKGAPFDNGANVSGAARSTHRSIVAGLSLPVLN